MRWPSLRPQPSVGFPPRPELALWWVGVTVEEFVGVVGLVDLGLVGAVGAPGQATGVGDSGFYAALGEKFVVGSAGEEQGVGIGAAADCPVRAVVDFALLARCEAGGSAAAAVAGVADDALVGGGDPGLAAQVERAGGVVVEHSQVMHGAGSHPDQVAHR